MNRTTSHDLSSSSRFGFCDLLRALACLMVFWDQNGPMRFPDWRGTQLVRTYICNPLGVIEDFGNMGVMLFFLISGFLFAFSLEKSKQLVPMLLKRLIRILVPLMAITVVFYGVQAVYGFMIGAPTYFAQFGFGDWFQSATLLSYFLSHPDAIYGVTWFLVPLIVFQLLGTLSYGLMRRRELPCCLLMTVGFMALFWAVGRFPGCFGILSYLQYLPVLLSGCILYWYRRECFSRKSAGMLLALTFTVFLALCRRCSPDRFSVPESIPLQFFWGAAIFIIVMLLDAQKPFSVPGSVLLLARISFGVYLGQMTFGALALDAALRLWPAIPLGLAILVSFLLTILIAAAFHQWIEKPLGAFLASCQKARRYEQNTSSPGELRKKVSQ